MKKATNLLFLRATMLLLVLLTAPTVVLWAQEVNEKFSMTTLMFLNEQKAQAEQAVKGPRRTPPARRLPDGTRLMKPRRLIASPDTVGGVAYISCFIHLKDAGNLSDVRALGVEVEETFDGLDFVTARVPVNQLEPLADIDNVTKIKVAQQMRPLTDKAREVTNVDDLLTQSNDATALGITSKYDGTGVILGIIDTGIDFQHIAFKDENGNSRIKRAYVYTGSGAGTEYTTITSSSPTTDDNTGDHGTHTASTAGGSSVIVSGSTVTVTDDHANATYGGMAPGADLYLAGIRNLYDTGLSNALTKMVEYADDQRKPLVVSNSWGSREGPRDGTGELASLVANYFGDSHPNRVILFAASNDAGHRNGNEGGGYFVKKSSASDSSPLGTIIRTDGDGGDYYEGLIACAWNASNSTKLNCRLHVLNSSGTILYSWTITENNTKIFNGLDTYYTGSMTVYIEEVNGKYHLTVYSEKGLESTSSGAYTLAIEVYPESESANINMWSGELSFFTDNYTTSGHTWLDGTDDMCVSDEATIPDAISVGAYVSKKNWNDYNGSPHTSNFYTVGDIAYFSSYATADQSPTGLAYPWISAPGARLAAGVNHYHTTSVDDYSYYGSTYNKNLVVNSSTNPYAMMEGTSMATPVAAGIVALWLQASLDPNAKHKNLTVNDVKEIMEATATYDSYTNGTNASHFGKGKIDALAGIQYILGSSASPVIMTTPTSIDFADKIPYATRSYTKPLNVKGFNLEGDITATLTDANGVYSLSQTTITKSAAAHGVDIIITYAPQSAGKHDATITLSSSNAKNVEVPVTATAQAGTPIIYVDPETLTFTAGLNEQKSLTFDMLTEFLTDDVTVSLSDNNNVFSIDKTSITKADSEEGATVTVTFQSATAGTFNGTVTLSSAGVEPETISLTATATIPMPTTPTGLALSEVTSSSLTALWTAVANATSYELDIVKGSSFEASAGGTVLESDFSDTTGWTLSGTGTYTSSPYIGNGSPSIKFSDSNDYAISPEFSSGTKLQFWAYGNGGSGSEFAISGLVNGTWTDIETVIIAQGGATYEVNLPAGTSQIRFDFTKSVNCALDDVVVYGPGNSPESVDGYPKSVGNVSSYEVTDLTSGTQYAVRVRAVNDGGNSDWSATATTTTIANIAPVWSAFPTNVSTSLGGEDIELMISDYVSGTPTPTFSMIATANSADYEFDPIDGYFTFTPSATGTFTFYFTAYNDAGSANATLTVTVSQPQSSSDDEFALVTSAADFVEGDYIIVYDGGAMNTTISSNRLQYTAVTPTNDVITTDDATIIWHIAPSGNYYTIYNADKDKYAAGTGTKNQAQLLDDGTDDKSLWSVTKGATFDFTNKYNSASNVNVNATLRYNAGYGFACYSTQTGGKLSLYKKTSGGTNPAIAYYQNADGKQGATLKTAMCGIIYNRTEKTYDDLWTAFKTTDVKNNGKIWDMYSNITDYTPVTSGSSYSQEGDCYNREHSWPQSWFGSNTPMYTDLHHIYPTDGFVNGKRANYPFGETNGTGQGSYQSNGGFSKLGTCTYPGYTGIVFEPADEYKGDFARTYFYMVTCYEEKLHDWYTNYSSTDVVNVIDGSTYPGLQAWQLEMLMKWAKNDPVSEKEINRNNAVYAIQNNRNPFIDYPGLEQYIWGTMTTTAFSYDNYVQPANAVTVPTLAVDEDNVTDTTAPVSWTACDGVTEYTLQLASDDLFTTGTAGNHIEFFSNDANNPSSAPDGWTYNVGNTTGSYLQLFSGHYVVTEAFDTSNCEDLSLSLKMRTYGGTSQPSVTVQYSTDGGTTWSESLGTLSAANSSMAPRSIDVSAVAGCSSVRLRIASTSTSSTVGVGIQNIVLTGTESAASLISSTTVNGTEYTFTGLTPYTVYYARVKGNSDWSNVEEFITEIGTLDLANDEDNSDAINAAATNGGKYDVTLSNRTLYKDGAWNTLCLPFSLSAGQIAASDLAGADIRTLSETSFSGGTLTLDFTPKAPAEGAVTSIEAGTPYILKWAKADGYDQDSEATRDINNPVFTGVTIPTDYADGSVKTTDIEFIGTTSPVVYDAGTAHKDVFFLGSGSTLYYPDGISETSINACRAYFRLNNGLTMDDPTLSRFVLNFGDSQDTGIRSLTPNPSPFGEGSAQWFTLDGRKLSGKPTAKGLYIYNGKAVVIK